MATTHIELDSLNEEQQQALNLVENTNFSFFLTGRAGTGKTTFLHYIQEHVDKQFVVVAPTGVAAIIAGGVTIHSFFGMPLDPITPTTEFQINPDRQTMLHRVDAIIIDEVSMVRCDIIDGIDRILRKVMRSSQPFGGKQIIFSGDLYQLEPVLNKRDTGLMQFFRTKYNTAKAYFYEAEVFKRLKLPRIEFKKVYRQTDEQFLSILNKIRSGQYNPAELALLNNSGMHTMQGSDENTLTLCSRNDTADSININRLSALIEKTFIYTGIVDGDFQNKRFPVQQTLALKVGARVMFCRNDNNHRWVNGTVGTIANLTDKKIEVWLDNGQLCNVEQTTWENVTYTYNKETKSLDKEIIGTYTQYPLKLAWAITIHKSQGMTFDKMNIDFSRGAFMPGQLYVALSRVTSLAGLGLSSPILPYYVSQRPEIDQFLQQNNSMDSIRTDVAEYKAYNQALLVGDYDMAARECQRLMHEAIQRNALDDAYYAAVKLLDCLYDTHLLHVEQRNTLLSGEDAHTLLLNTLLSIENGDYSIAVALAERGMMWGDSADLYYLKSIALSRMGNLPETLSFNDVWQKFVRSEDNVIDCRCLYQIAQTDFAADRMFITNMQTVIQHNPWYMPAYETLRRMMHAKQLYLQTTDEHCTLVEVFNSASGNLTAAWMCTEADNRRALLKAILDYPYEEE